MSIDFRHAGGVTASTAVAGRFSGNQNRHAVAGRGVGVPAKQRRWFAVLQGRGRSLRLWFLARRKWRVYLS